ncbi:hypothetical protein MHYP_G00006700 [Metynnis hypsauchen]
MKRVYQSGSQKRKKRKEEEQTKKNRTALYHQQHFSLMRKTTRKKTWKKLHPVVPWPQQHQHILSLHHISALVLPLQHKTGFCSKDLNIKPVFEYYWRKLVNC